MMKKMFALMVFCLLGIVGCGGGGGSGSGSVNSTVNKPLVSIKVTPSDNVLAVGLQKQFTAMGTYSDGKEKDVTTEVTWSSSNAGAAAISNDQSTKGMLTVFGHSAQSIIITARLDSISGTTNLTVPALALVAIAVTPENTTMAAGTSYNYKATGTYSDGISRDITGAVQWTSSLPSVATVALGKVTGIAAGDTTLTATLGSIAGSTNLKVTSAALQSISITPSNTNLAIGTNGQFSATGQFSDGSTQDLTTAVVWSSSAPAIAAISAEGIVTAVSVGNTTISAFYKNIPSDITVSTGLTVSNVELQTIAITPGISDLTVGSTRQLKAIGSYSNGTTQDLTSSVTWESSDPTIAGVVENNTLLASKVGSATIKATLGGVSVSAGTTITPADVSGTWTGTYTIYDDPADPSQIGTYNFSMVLTQSNGVLSGTTTLRESRTDTAVSKELTGNIWDRRIDFRFTYFSPFFSRLMENLGQLEITNGTMKGSAVENYNSGYNCSYVISVTKQP